MSLWNRIAAKLRPHSEARSEVSLVDDRLVFHTRARATEVPNEPDKWGASEMSACQKCSGTLRRVVFTTAGEGEQIALWRDYPLAVDGWLCAECGGAVVPRRMSAQEVTDCLQSGAQHAKKGALDDAEYWFRRAACSWPDYAPSLVNLAEVAISRAADKARTPAERATLRKGARRYLVRAIERDPTHLSPTGIVHLARLEAFDGQETEAVARLEELARRDGLQVDVRSEANALLAQIREGRALFSRAAELARDLILIAGREPVRLSSSEQDRLAEASRLLESASSRNPRAFATWWMLGKVQQRLGDYRAALTALRRAVECDPSQVDGCREYVCVCLELGDGNEAMRMARRACELRPEDVGLRSNLAVAELIAGRVDEASKTVEAAVKADPADNVTRILAEQIASIRNGHRPLPRNLSELKRGR